MKSKVVWMDTIISLTITVGCFVQMDRWITHGPTQTGTGRRREELYLVPIYFTQTLQFVGKLVAIPTIAMPISILI